MDPLPSLFDDDEPVDALLPTAPQIEAPQEEVRAMSAASGQNGLFDRDEFAYWHNEWQNMPEFIQPDLAPAKSLVIHFPTQADLAAFAKLVGQRIAMTTRSIWYPELEIGHVYDKRYLNVDAAATEAALAADYQANGDASEEFDVEP